MRTLVVAFALLASVSLSAQSFLISNFTALPSGGNFTTSGSWATPVNQLSLSSGIMSITAIGGGSPDDSGNFGFADLISTFNATTAFDTIVAVARVDSGNSSNGFIVNLFDSQGTGALTATFAASSFNSATFVAVPSNITVHPENGNRADIAFFGIAGVGTTAAFRFSFDSLTAVPEPSTYAAIFGVLALGFVAYRRRMQSV
ncbi:MAG: PEP-CTERM sorting domain-containing protein [Candidatus Didemnitutus sp.]|nr:PEP-CTERM sorting domain-containing protein [Candidatus Didemnitutus sp.]